MENDAKQQILRIIEQANFAYLEAISPENKKQFGYAYYAGYAHSALANIKDLMEKV